MTLPSHLRSLAGAAAFLIANGCASPAHLQYDYGRAYTAAIVSQADLTRPSVANAQYQLYGTEAEAIRIRVREKTTDEETQDATLTLQ